jgi:hypothetical protein
MKKLTEAEIKALVQMVAEGPCKCRECSADTEHMLALARACRTAGLREVGATLKEVSDEILALPAMREPFICEGAVVPPPSMVFATCESLGATRPSSRAASRTPRLRET